jgi:lipid A 3-O-deacylase
MHRIALPAALAALSLASSAAAQEVFAGVYAHEVDTPFTLKVGESGADIALGYRFAPIEPLGVVGKPAPYVVASLNTAGDTSFVGAGLSWSIGNGPVYVRPGIGVVVHDGPALRVDPVARRRTDLGSRVLFEPEIGVGYRLNERLSLEAHWMHISQARLFNRRQNPGIDMIGLRVNYRP